jgi:hypothetical protein
MILATLSNVTIGYTIALTTTEHDVVKQQKIQTTLSRQ